MAVVSAELWWRRTAEVPHHRICARGYRHTVPRHNSVAAVRGSGMSYRLLGDRMGWMVTVLEYVSAWYPIQVSFYHCDRRQRRDWLRSTGADDAVLAAFVSHRLSADYLAGLG